MLPASGRRRILYRPDTPLRMPIPLMTTVTRRDALRLLAMPAAFAALGYVPLGASRRNRAGSPARLKVLVTGGHPDDPESGCGGTIAR